MTLENLLRIGKLKAHAADEGEIARLLESAQRERLRRGLASAAPTGSWVQAQAG